MLDSITFLTGNKDKLREAQEILKGVISIVGKRIDLPELQSVEVKEVVRKKALDAYALLATPVITEDTGFFIGDDFNGFPGALIKHFHTSLADEGICKLAGGMPAYVQAALAYCDAQGVHILSGRVAGRVAKQPRGSHGFGWDAIFIPEGSNKTFAEMKGEEKHAFSHRKRVLIKFSQWLQER